MAAPRAERPPISARGGRDEAARRDGAAHGTKRLSSAGSRRGSPGGSPGTPGHPSDPRALPTRAICGVPRHPNCVRRMSHSSPWHPPVPAGVAQRPRAPLGISDCPQVSRTVPWHSIECTGVPQCPTGSRRPTVSPWSPKVSPDALQCPFPSSGTPQCPPMSHEVPQCPTGSSATPRGAQRVSLAPHRILKRPQMPHSVPLVSQRVPWCPPQCPTVASWLHPVPRHPRVPPCPKCPSVSLVLPWHLTMSASAPRSPSVSLNVPRGLTLSHGDPHCPTGSLNVTPCPSPQCPTGSLSVPHCPSVSHIVLQCPPVSHGWHLGAWGPLRGWPVGWGHHR